MQQAHYQTEQTARRSRAAGIRGLVWGGGISLLCAFRGGAGPLAAASCASGPSGSSLKAACAALDLGEASSYPGHFGRSAFQLFPGAVDFHIHNQQGPAGRRSQKHLWLFISWHD